jgi:hypothetical protein
MADKHIRIGNINDGDRNKNGGLQLPPNVICMSPTKKWPHAFRGLLTNLIAALAGVAPHANVDLGNENLGNENENEGVKFQDSAAVCHGNI